MFVCNHALEHTDNKDNKRALTDPVCALSLRVAGGTRLQNRPPGVRVHRGGVGIHLSGHPEAGWKLRTKHTAL